MRLGPRVVIFYQGNTFSLFFLGDNSSSILNAFPFCRDFFGIGGRERDTEGSLESSLDHSELGISGQSLVIHDLGTTSFAVRGYGVQK